MLKTIIFLLKVLILVFISLIAVLMYGITASNLSYENISISKLYLKYDKKLILNLKNIAIGDKLSNSKEIIDLSITLDIIDSDYVIGIKNIEYKNLGLKLSGDLKLNNEEIDKLINIDSKNLEVYNAIFNYDTNLSDIKSDIVYLNYYNDNLNLKFKNPSMDGVKIDRSTVILENMSSSFVLKLDLYTKNLLEPKLLNIVKYYGIDIPVYQTKGDNEINFKLDLPFDDRSAKIYVKGEVSDTIAQLWDINFTSKSAPDPLK